VRRGMHGDGPARGCRDRAVAASIHTTRALAAPNVTAPFGTAFLIW